MRQRVERQRLSSNESSICVARRAGHSHRRIAVAAVAVHDGVGEQLFDDQPQAQTVARCHAASAERLDEGDRLGEAVHAGPDGASYRVVIVLAPGAG